MSERRQSEEGEQCDDKYMNKPFVEPFSTNRSCRHNNNSNEEIIVLVKGDIKATM